MSINAKRAVALDAFKAGSLLYRGFDGGQSRRIDRVANATPVAIATDAPDNRSMKLSEVEIKSRDRLGIIASESPVLLE